MKRKLIRVAASPISLDLLLKGQLNYLNGFFDVLAVASPGAEHARIRRREGVETVELEMERTISLWKDLKSLWRLFLLFRRERPWGVHSVTPKAGLLSMAAAALARVPVRVHTFTGLIFPYRKGAFKFLLKQMDRLTCLFATHVIPEGEGVRQLLMAEKVTGKPLEILAHGNVNGVDPDYFRRSGCREEVRKRLELPEDAMLFVLWGALRKTRASVSCLPRFPPCAQRPGVLPFFWLWWDGRRITPETSWTCPACSAPVFRRISGPGWKPRTRSCCPATGRDFPIRCCRRVPWNCPPLPRIYAGAMRL